MARELKLGFIETAEVIDLSSDGRGIARVAGKAVFIEGALPGETVQFRTFKRRKQMDEAAVVKVLVPSVDRVEPRCAHFGVCGGCSLQHLSAAAQLAAKQRQLLDNLERIGRVRPEQILPPLSGPAWGYRRRARLGVKYVHKKGRLLCGFRERDKPYVADLKRCEVLLERFATLPQQIAALVETLSLREHVRQIEVSAGDPGTPGAGGCSAALVFRIMKELPPDDAVKLRDFGSEHAVQIYLQSGGRDSVVPLLDDYAPLRYAPDENGVTLEFGPLDFVQVNRDVNVSMVAAAIEALQPTPADRVLDLFCGLGNFTLSLARRAEQVVGVEGDSALVEKARGNALRNGVRNVSFHTADLLQPDVGGAWAEATYDLLLLDPPRAGAPEIMVRAAQWRPRRVVYISCHPGSLARDAAILIEGQGFKLTGAGVMDMFPHTAHVESIAVFERVS